MGAIAFADNGGFGQDQVGTSNADGVLLASNQRVQPAGDRLLVNDGRIVSSSISPDGHYLAALTWHQFTGFLTIIDLKSRSIVQQVGTGVGADQTLGDGTVAADGPLWSADGSTLWVSQTADILRFSVGAGGMLAPNPVSIALETQTTNLNSNTTTQPDLPSGMALSGDGAKLYVALNGVNQLGVIDTATNQLVQQIPVGNAPRQVVLVGHTAYVSNEGGRPARPGQYTNQSDGTAVVADKVTGAATSGTVSVVDLVSGQENSEIQVGLQPTALYLAKDGTLLVANSNSDSVSLISTATNRVEQTINVNPLPGSTVGSYPNAIAMPDATHLLVSIGRDNAIAVYDYRSARRPARYLGLIPTDQYPVNVALDPATGRIVVTNDKGIGSRGPVSSINKGAGTAPAPAVVTGHNTYNDTASITQFAMPNMAQLSVYTGQVFKNNDWTHLLASTPITGSGAAPAAIPARLGDPSSIKHVFVFVRENRTYDQVFGDLGKGNGDPTLAQFGQTITPNAHALTSTYGTFDNFYDEGTLSADGHNWIVQADANDYIEKEFGSFYRSYPAQGGDALAYQRDGFLWNAAHAAGQTVQAFGEYNNFYDHPNATWSQYYQDSQILEGKASGPLPVPESAIHTYSDIPSLNAIDYPQYPPFDMGIPDQYRADVWQQAFAQDQQTGRFPNLSLIWLPTDHTGGPPTPTAQVADNDLALGRMIDTITHSSIWPQSAIFVMEDDSQNGVDHVDGHRAPLLVVSPYAKKGIVDSTYYSQINVVKTIEQILGIAPMNQEDRAAEPMTDAFTDTPDLTPFSHLANQVPLTTGVPPTAAAAAAAPAGAGSATTAGTPASVPAADQVPAAEQGVYQQWLVWQRSGRFTGTHPLADWANPEQLNRFDWYSAHNWTVPYPGDQAILAPSEVPGANLPQGYQSEG